MEQTYSSVIEKEFCKLVDESIADLSDSICKGNSISTIEEFREKIGILKGLRSSKELIEEASELVHKRNRGI